MPNETDLAERLRKAADSLAELHIIKLPHFIDLCRESASTIERLQAELEAKWQPVDQSAMNGDPVIIAQEGGGIGEAFYETEREHEGWYWANAHWTDAYDGSVRGNVIAYQSFPLPPPPKAEG